MNATGSNHDATALRDLLANSAGLVLPDAMLDALQAAYATPPRAYHHFGHVLEVLGHYARVAADTGWRRPREVALAVLYHDAIYVAGRSDNESRSAALAREHIASWLPDAAIDPARVATLIDATARHGQWSPDDFARDPAGDDTRRFLDCDMAILGADSAAFDAYDAAIAQEYLGVVPRWIYRRKRRAFLAGLLQRPRIYLDDGFHARLDATARANLQRAVHHGVAG